MNRYLFSAFFIFLGTVCLLNHYFSDKMFNDITNWPSANGVIVSFSPTHLHIGSKECFVRMPVVNNTSVNPATFTKVEYYGNVIMSNVDFLNSLKTGGIINYKKDPQDSTHGVFLSNASKFNLQNAAPYIGLILIGILTLFVPNRSL